MKPVLTIGLIGSFVFSSLVHAQAWQALPDVAPVPADNPQTQEKVTLGKILFFDPRLSSTGTVSCNSCHNVMSGGDDNRPHSVGVDGKVGGRSAPTVWNSAFLSVQFWDGREPTLEEQARGPVTNPIEMGMPDWEAVMTRLKAIPGYQPLFQAAFPKATEPMTADNAVKAIAAYERTLITPNSLFDQSVKKEATLPEQAQRGFETFQAVGCPACHSGVNFAGPKVPPEQEGFFMKFPTMPDTDYEKQYRLTEDGGRFEVTEKEEDKHMWRVPTLRNVALTAPYFHNGAVPTLDMAVRVMAKTQLNQDLTDEQVADIVAFLNTLTGEFPEQTMPRLPASPGQTVIDDIKTSRTDD